MNIYDLITLLGGLAMFLYGMRTMGNGLKESSSGTLKNMMERVTNTPVKAFLLGLATTALVQSSTATIVITSGLVAAGIISLHQSIGIIVGANVGTTITGQIIRLLDLNVDDAGFSLLRLIQPSTLAPLAMIIGIVMIMGVKKESSEKIGQIILCFGIAFSGLLSMTQAVRGLQESGIIENLFSNLGHYPVIGYVIGAAVAFVLQSSSASVGILQAFSVSGELTFKAIYAVLVGIYLGDCVTTAIVINIRAKADAKRVGYVNIIFNLCKSVAILLVITVIHHLGLLNSLWSTPMSSGGIANMHTIFNLACAILLSPFLGFIERLSYKIVKEEEVASDPYEELSDKLNPVFLSTPAIALGSCADVLTEIYTLANKNISTAISILRDYDEEKLKEIAEDEDHIDQLADKVGNYLVQISANISSQEHVGLMNNYYSDVIEFERLGDHAMNIAEIAKYLKDRDMKFSEQAIRELTVVEELLNRILSYSRDAFCNGTITSARHIEPLEEVVDDIVITLKDRHLERLRKGECSVVTGNSFLGLLSEIERISDICSNIGVATVSKMHPELENQVHDYISLLHAGRDEEFNNEYQSAHDLYFGML